MKVVEKFTKSVTFTMNHILTLETKNDVYFVTPKTDVAENLKCWLQWYPNGDRAEAIGHIGIFLWVSGPCKANCTITLIGTNIKKNSGCVFVKREAWGWKKFVSHQEVEKVLKTREIVFQCDAEFEVELYPSQLSHRILENCGDVPTDCEFVVGNRSVKAHKHFLAFVAPSLHANFTHNTIEAKTGKVVITDFDFKTVKVCIDYLYGRDLENTTIQSIVEMLRFFDKYNIKSKRLDRIPYINITADSFCIIVQFAYDCCKNDLLDDCVKFCSENLDAIKLQRGLIDLPRDLVITIFERAFSLTSTIDILLFAHQKRVTDIIVLLESNLSITRENYRKAAKYAREYRCLDLQNKCRKFLDEI